MPLDARSVDSFSRHSDVTVERMNQFSGGAGGVYHLLGSAFIFQPHLEGEIL